MPACFLLLPAFEFPAVESEDRWHNKPLYYQDLAELFFVTFDHQPGLYSGYTFIISGSPKNPGAAIHPKVEHQISFHFLLTAAQLWRDNHKIRRKKTRL